MLGIRIFLSSSFCNFISGNVGVRNLANNETDEGERDHEEDPGDKASPTKFDLAGIDTKGESRACRLECLVETCVSCKDGGIVGHGTHGPVQEGLINGVSETVHHVQEEGSTESRISPVLGLVVASIEAELEDETADPDAGRNKSHDNQANETSLAT